MKKLKYFGFYVNGLYVQTPHNFTMNAPLGEPETHKLSIWTLEDQKHSDLDENPVEAALLGAHETFLQVQAGFFTLPERLGFLERLKTKLSEQKDNLAQLMCRETGKPLQLARTEVDRALETIQGTLNTASGFFAPKPISTPGSYSVEVRREARGPLLAITPFNYPLNLIMHKLAPALAAGCPVVLKPSAKAQLSALTLCDFCHACELPPGMLSMIQVENTLVPQLIQDERIAQISFTGSAKVGWSLAALTTKPFALELGGNAPVYVDDSADLTAAATKIALGATAHAGQVCISVQNIFVHHKAELEFTKHLRNALERVVWGHPAFEKTWSGPAIDAEATERLRALETDLFNHGAEVVAQASETAQKLPPDLTPELFKDSQNLSGLIQPKFFSKVPLDHAFFNSEIFGPFASLSSVESFDKFVLRANANKARLQCGVFTSRPEQQQQAASDLRYGGVVINDTSAVRVDGMPYGGRGLAGRGREGPLYALEEFTEYKSVIAPKA